MANEANDQDIRDMAARLQSISAYLERYPRPSSVNNRIDELRQLIENLALKAYVKGE